MARADSLRMRAGQIFCACDIDGLPLDLDTLPKDSSIVRMAFAFGASVLAQVLTLSALPLASASITLPLSHVPWPYLAMLLGAALAGFPAALLIDRMGRRSAFALGASLGIAGGILSAWAMMARLPQPFIIGVLWLGMAQGFGLFYRHAGAMAGGAGGLVFGAGSLGAIIGPFIIEAAQNIGGPLAPASTREILKRNTSGRHGLVRNDGSDGAGAARNDRLRSVLLPIGRGDGRASRRYVSAGLHDWTFDHSPWCTKHRVFRSGFTRVWSHAPSISRKSCRF